MGHTEVKRIQKPIDFYIARLLNYSFDRFNPTMNHDAIRKGNIRSLHKDIALALLGLHSLSF